MKKTTIKNILKGYCLSILLILIPVFKVRAVEGGSSVRINNPLTAESLVELIEAVLEGVVTLGAPVVALFIIISGVMLVMAQGNQEKITKAKTAIIWTLAGAGVVLGAFAIINLIQATVDTL
ncbi:MAG: hypothetical protein ACOCU8_01605 [Patescibacteria group bacterium]